MDHTSHRLTLTACRFQGCPNVLSSRYWPLRMRRSASGSITDISPSIAPLPTSREMVEKLSMVGLLITRGRKKKCAKSTGFRNQKLNFQTKIKWRVELIIAGHSRRRCLLFAEKESCVGLQCPVYLLMLVNSDNHSFLLCPWQSRPGPACIWVLKIGI